MRALPSILREVGRAMAKDLAGDLKSRTRRERIEAALALLNDLGGSAGLAKRKGRRFIEGRNGCPLAAITANHPQACLIVESLLSETISLPVERCCEYGERPHCCFEIG